VAASTGLLLLSIALNGWELAPLRVNPMVGPSPQVLIDLGALSSERIVEFDEWHRLVVPTILHAGVVHYVINMFALWYVGVAVERIHGTAETAFVFLISAVGGNLLSALFMPHTISVGASGGIFGLLGTCLADVFVNWDLITIREDEKRYRFPYAWVFFWLFVEVLITIVAGLTPYIDNVRILYICSCPCEQQ